MSSLTDMLSEEFDERFVRMRDSLARATKDLAKEKDRTDALTSAVYQAANDAAITFTLPKIKMPVFRSTKQAEVCVPMLSDTQLGKKTMTYDSDICAARVDRYADKIIELAEITRSHHPVKVCHVAFLGDMVEGETIFPGQHWLIDTSLFRQTMVNGPQILIAFLSKLLGAFEKVVVTCVDGNHGIEGGVRRSLHHPETNSDRMLYTFVQTVMEMNYPDRISFDIASFHDATEKNWYSIMEIGKYRALCIHGYEIKGNGPWHGLTLAKKVNGWAAGGIDEHFDDVFMGHYHSAGIIPLNRRKVYVNGSTESRNDYARQTLSAQSDPTQWTLFVHPEKGHITANYDVHLMEEN